MTVRVGFRQTANIPHSFLKASNLTTFVLQKVTKVLNTFFTLLKVSMNNTIWDLIKAFINHVIS